MNSRERIDAAPRVASGLAASDPNEVVEFLRRHWTLPLQTTGDVDRSRAPRSLRKSSETHSPPEMFGSCARCLAGSLAVLASPPATFSGQVLSERATALLRRPTSTVFDERRFREAFDKMRKLAAERGVDTPEVEE